MQALLKASLRILQDELPRNKKELSWKRTLEK